MAKTIQPLWDNSPSLLFSGGDTRDYTHLHRLHNETWAIVRKFSREFLAAIIYKFEVLCTGRLQSAPPSLVPNDRALSFLYTEKTACSEIYINNAKSKFLRFIVDDSFLASIDFILINRHCLKNEVENA